MGGAIYMRTQWKGRAGLPNALCLVYISISSRRQHHSDALLRHQRAQERRFQFLNSTRSLAYQPVESLWVERVLQRVFQSDLNSIFRPRYLLTASAVGCGCLALLLHFGHSFLIATICYGLIGFLGFLFWPPIMGWLAADLECAALGKAMSRYNISMSVAGIAGAPLAG